MTEQDWLTSEDPRVMLEHLTESLSPNMRRLGAVPESRVSDRKMRLFACACCRQAWERFTDAKARSAVEVAERHADGLTDANERGKAFNVAETISDSTQRLPALACLRASVSSSVHDILQAYLNRSGSRLAQARLVREIIGNPFRPILVSADWLTHDVKRLAQDAYDSSDFSSLAVLSDALEEAGCPLEEESPCPRCLPYHADPENPFGVGPGYHPERDPASGRHEGGWTNCKACNGGPRCVRPGVVRAPHPILAHLRSPGPHVRGCWALDLILGKE